MVQSQRAIIYSVHNDCWRSVSYFCQPQSWYIHLMRCHDDRLYSRIWMGFCILQWRFLCHITRWCSCPTTWSFALHYAMPSLLTCTQMLQSNPISYSLDVVSLLFLNTHSDATPRCALCVLHWHRLLYALCCMLLFIWLIVKVHASTASRDNRHITMLVNHYLSDWIAPLTDQEKLDHQGTVEAFPTATQIMDGTMMRRQISRDECPSMYDYKWKHAASQNVQVGAISLL